MAATVESAHDASLPTTPSSQEEKASLYVGNLPWSTKWQDLKDLFKQAGAVLYADIPRTPQNRSRGFGIVRFATKEEAMKAVEMFDGYELNGRAISVREDQYQRGGVGNGNGPMRSGKSAESGSVPEESENTTMNTASGDRPARKEFKQVFVGNLAWSVSWQDLKDLAKEHELNPLRSDVAIGYDGRSRGWGTLSFGSDEECQQAIGKLNGIEVGGRPIEVREDRKNKY